MKSPVFLLIGTVLGLVDTQVQTSNGPIIGYLDNGISSFKNIPYGADTATTRFKPPKLPAPWSTPKVCTAFGDIAPQPWGRDIAGARYSEDCLNLNVWTPALDNKTRPVLVYFHGGGYEHLTVNDDLYDGRQLSQKRDVVVVTVNHRVNGFGYLYFGGVSEEYKQGNPGQLDLILALRWIQDNIAKFGGDKSSVTIFGQSGGGAKCATLMAMPEAKGLFHKVWTMSGQQITGRTLEHAKEDVQELLAKLGSGPILQRMKTLETMPLDELRRLMVGDGKRWTPTTDGVTLPRDPFYPTANEQSKDIPMVIGNTYDETTTLIGSGKPALFNLQWDAVPSALESNVKQFIGNMTGQYIVDSYRKQYPDFTPSDVFFAATTAARSWKSMVVESDIRARQPNSPLWVYYFRWRSPAAGLMRAGHGADIPFVFANANASAQTRGNKEADELAEVVSKALVQLARTGRPEVNVPGLAWPRYELQTRKSMIFDSKVVVHDDDRGWERKFFESAEYIQPGT